MPSSNLHGAAPDTSHAALLLVDVINDFAFEGGDALLHHARPAAGRLASLAQRCRDTGVPVIYANDNFGRWQSEFARVLDRCRAPDSPGRDVVELLAPHANDYFVLKPKNSGFFHTTLELLLQYIQPRTLILAGWQTNNCVLFTANDAYLRDYRLLVPPDCCAAEETADHDAALRQMRLVLKAHLTDSEQIDPAAPG